jgi:hypothetical protein
MVGHGRVSCWLLTIIVAFYFPDFFPAQDSSSALLVMSSLKHLVTNQGVTIVSVIHQPRKFIFDLFDSMILLGVGGKMVYHGPTRSANDYFFNLGYVLPEGESVADWLIDISSGGTEPEPNMGTKKVKKLVSMIVTNRRLMSGTNGTRVPGVEEPAGQDMEFEATPDTTDYDAQGLSGGTALVRRAWLYDRWNHYFTNLMSDEEKAGYEKPEVTNLPEGVVKPPFVTQLWNQTTRALLVSRRSATEKLIDTSVLVGATIVLCLMSKVPKMTRNYVPDITFEDVVRPSKESAPDTLKQLFTFAAVPQIP